MRFLILSYVLVISNAVSGQNRYSGDSTGVYTIDIKDDEYEAVPEKSSGKENKEGVLVLQHVTYSNKKEAVRWGNLYCDYTASNHSKNQV